MDDEAERTEQARSEHELLRQEAATSDAELAQRLLPRLLTRTETGEPVTLPDVDQPTTIITWKVASYTNPAVDPLLGAAVNVDLLLGGDGKLYERIPGHALREVRLDRPPVSIFAGLIELGVMLGPRT